MISLFGTDAITLPRQRLPGFRRRIGVVYQDYRLVPHLSAFDNVALPLRVAGIPERDVVQPVKDMLEWVGLADRMGAKPATLSGGEQQRVAIARAVIGRPELLVADEPTGNVDPDMAVKLLRLFEALNRLGTTVVVATHDMHLLQKVPGSLIMRLDKGRMSIPPAPALSPRRGAAMTDMDGRDSVQIPHRPISAADGPPDAANPWRGSRFWSGRRQAGRMARLWQRGRGGSGAAGAAVGADALGYRHHGHHHGDRGGDGPCLAQHCQCRRNRPCRGVTVQIIEAQAPIRTAQAQAAQRRCWPCRV
jgi:cell division transport system ATP-binding protein